MKSQQTKKVVGVPASTTATPTDSSTRELPFTIISDGTLENDVAALLKHANHSAMADFVRTFGRAKTQISTTPESNQLEVSA